MATLLTHPVKARILAAMLGRNLTTQQIGKLLPEVPTPSLYRHIRALADAGILRVVEEVRISGAPTRVYAVRTERSRIRPEDVRDIGKADQLRYFTTFLDLLRDRFHDYLTHGPEDFQPDQEPHHALMTSLHLSPDEYEEFFQKLNTFLEPYRALLPPGDDRRRVVFAHIVLPDRADPPRE